MISPEFIAQCGLQHTEQEGAIEWFIDNEAGGYFAVIDGWSVRFKGDGNYGHLIYQKGPKFGEIIAQKQSRFNKDVPQINVILRSLLIEIRKMVYPENQDTISLFEKQEQKIRKEFIASVLGWDK